MVEAQVKPTYINKFLKEPPTVAVSLLWIGRERSELMECARWSDVHSGVYRSLPFDTKLIIPKRWTGTLPPFILSAGSLTHIPKARPGVDLGPNALVQSGLLEQIKSLGWNVTYDGGKPFADIPRSSPDEARKEAAQGKMKNARVVSEVCQRLAKVVGEHAGRGELPVTVGGDHSLVSVTISS